MFSGSYTYKLAVAMSVCIAIATITTVEGVKTYSNVCNGLGG